MKTMKYFTAAVATMALAACNDDLGLGGFANDPNAVHITASVGDTFARSNPTGDATTVTQFNEGDKIAVSSNGQGAAVYQFDGTDWTPVTPDKYLTWDSSSQPFTAYYPDTYKGSGNVPQAQGTREGIAAADYMKFEGELEKQASVSFTMLRQTARVVINSSFKWGAEYLDINGAPTHKVESIKVNCTGVSDIETYRSGNYHALVNPGAAAPDATFLTLSVSPLDGNGASKTHTVRGIPAFKAGYSYTYNITIGKNGVTLSNVTVEDWGTGSIVEGGMDDNVTKVFAVNVPEKNFTCVGGSRDYGVNSYVKTGDGSLVAIPWTAKFVRKLNDGTYQEIKQGEADYPTWITNLTDKGIGDKINDICTVTVASAEISNNHYYIMKNNAPVNGTYNLANATGGSAVENTANCYIVNAAGTYSFPLVYGNAIKNGADNQSAYKSTVTGKNVLENFVNHKNEPITSPYIAAHSGCVPTNATLVWQDAENLVSNIQFVDGGSPEAHRITFDVAQWSIKQGNAIIAVRNAENSILWSWHIWITDYKPLQGTSVMNSYDPTVTQQDKKVWTYDNKNSCILMGVPLGWCDAESAAGREVSVLFTQTETGKTQEVVIKQEPMTIGNNCTYYQWGRKDPMLPSIGVDDKDKPHYGNYTYVKNGTGKASVGVSIQNPHVFYNFGGSGYYDWCSNSGTVSGKSFLFNLWDTHNNTINSESNSSSVTAKYTAPTKTVYDPSPVGYVIPTNGAMYGLTYNGVMTGGDWAYNRKQFNSPFNQKQEAIDACGWVFYCKGMGGTENKWNADGGVIYYPAIGFRDFYNGGEVRGIGNVGYFWEAVPDVNAFSYHSGFEIDRAVVFPGDGITYRANAMPVRPIREQ